MMSEFPFKCRHCDEYTGVRCREFDIYDEERNPETLVGDCDYFGRTEEAQWEELKWERDQLRQQLQSAEQQNEELQDDCASMRKAVEWMEQIAKYFAYKAPEQIDTVQLIAAMGATAKDALSRVKGGA